MKKPTQEQLPHICNDLDEEFTWKEIVQPTTVNGVSIRLPEFILYKDNYMISVRWNWDSSYWRARIYKEKLLWWIVDQQDTLADTMDAAVRCVLAMGSNNESM